MNQLSELEKFEHQKRLELAAKDDIINELKSKLDFVMQRNKHLETINNERNENVKKLLEHAAFICGIKSYDAKK